MSCAAVCAWCWQAAWHRWMPSRRGWNRKSPRSAERINNGAAEIESMETSQHSLTERGYELDHEAQEAQNRANAAAVELERAAARERSNAERVSELEARLASSAAELEQTRTQIGGHRRRAHSSSRRFSRRRQARQRRSTRRWRRGSTKRARPRKKCSTRSGSWRPHRRHAMHLLTLAGNARNSTAQGEESLAALEREAERLEAEMGQARNEQESLGVQSGQARLAI